MYDPFANAADSPISPSETCFAIAPHDTDELVRATKAIYVGSEGDITLRPLNGDADVVFRNVQAGSILDIRVRAIRLTGTTASDIVGLA